MPVSAKRVVAISAGALAVLLIAAILLVHLPAVRTRTLAFAARQLASRYGLDLQASRLDYNLFTRNVSLADVRLAASGEEQAPFFTAARVHVALPWTVFRGQLAFDRVDVEQAQVTILRRADGSSNLPHSDTPANPLRPALKLDIRNVGLHDLGFRYADEVRDLHIDAGAVEASLAHRAAAGDAEGPIAIGKGVQVRIGEHAIDAQPIAGRMAFDGSNLALDGLGITTREGALVIGGTVLRAVDQPSLQLRFDGTADLARAEDWAALPITIGGITTVKGTIEGPAAELTITVAAASTAARLGEVSGAGLDSHVTITPDAVVVDRATVRDGSGTLDASARIELGDAGATEVTASWQDLEAMTLLRVLNQARATARIDAAPPPGGVRHPNRRIAATMTGTMAMTRRPGQALTMTVQNRARASSSPARDAARLSGTLALDARDGRWTLKQSHAIGNAGAPAPAAGAPETLRIDGTIGGRITGNDIAAATVEGPLTVDSADVAAAATAIEQLDLDLPGIATAIRGPVHAAVTLGGRLDALQLQAAVASDALVIPGIAPANVQADLAVSADRVDVPAFTAQVGGGTLSGSAAIDLAAHTLGGGVSLEAPDAGALLTVLPASLALSGPITATATLGGTTSAPDVRAEVSGHGLSVAGEPIETLTASTRVTADTVFVDALSLTSAGGTLTGTGSYAWETEGYTANLHGAGLSWRGRLGSEAETEVRITELTFAGTGTVARPGGDGKIAFQLSGGAAGDIVESGSADVRLDGVNANIDASLPSLGAQVKATVLTSAPYTFDATADVARLDLLPLAGIAGLPANGVLGRLSFTATAHGEAGRAADSTEVDATLTQIAATVGDVPMWLAAPAQLSWRKDDLRVQSLSVGLGSGMLSASGRLTPGAGSQWTSTFSGEVSELLQAARGVATVPAALNASGQIAASWQSNGGIDQSSATVSLSGGQVAWGAVPPITALTLQAGFDGRTIALSSLTGTWQDGAISGTAEVPRALVDRSARAPGAAAPRGHAQLKVTGLTQAAIAPFVSSPVLEQIVGQVSATVDADILGTELKDIAGTLVLDEAKLNLANIEVQQARPTTIGIRDGRVTMDDVSWTAGGGPLALTGSVDLQAATGTELDLALKGDLNMTLLVAFAPTTWTAGSALVDLKVAGPANQPSVDGRIGLENGEVAVFNPRLILYDLNGDIVFNRNRVGFGGVAGSLNGGTIRLDGQLGLDAGSRSASGQMIVELGQVAMEFPKGLQSEIDGLITFGPVGRDWQLGGDVRIARSSYRDNISIPALAASNRSRAPIAADAEPTFLDRLRLNLFVVTEEDLNVDNNYGRIAAGAAVRVVNTATSPALTGRVTLREGGEVFLAGRTFRVERGAISFTSPTRIEPELDIELRTLAGAVDVALTLNGSFDQLKTEVRSTTPEYTDKEAQEALYGNLGGEDAATLLSAELLGVTGRAVGLDSLRLERGATDSDDFRNDPTLIVTDTNTSPTTRLTLSKRVRPDVEVTISRSIQDSGGVAAAVSYKIRRNIEIRASQRENTDRAIALRHEITFGGAARTVREATPQPRVAAVRFIGEPGQPDAALLELIKLKDGDRFAFHQWQHDVDRIKADYTRRGYYEARVRPSRQASEDGQSVQLDYRVDEGAKTTIVIEGHPAHTDLQQELEDAWSRAIFDRFLIDDVKARVTRDLMREGYIGSKIDVTIAQPDPGSKQLRVVVTPGTKVGGREVRFAGNQNISHGRLMGALAAAGVDEEVWLDPSKVAATLEPFYREQGYLAVKVAAGAPAVEGNRGILPVTIEEHARFTFAPSLVQGVGEARRQPLEQALGRGLQAGQPYDATTVEDARRRLERYYARQGFNNARIDIRATSNQAEGTVTVGVTVDEGLQQVLREVTTSGDDRTRDGVVRRALRLQEGQPVDLTQWAQARKRLYDTNVFAQVDIEPAALTPTEEDKAAGVEPVRAVVTLVEYPEWRLRYGLQLNDQRTGDEDVITRTSREQNLGVLADIQNRNLFGRAIAGGLAARVERDRQVGSLFASNGSFFGLPIRTQSFLFTSRERQTISIPDDEDRVYLYDRIGASVEQRYQASRRMEIVYAYRYDTTRTHQVGNSEIDATNHTGKVTAGVIVDRRNDPFAATRGWFTSANYEQAARVLGGDSRNGKLLIQEYFFHPVGKVVFASRAQIGSSFGRDRLAAENVFAMGGATTVRGYAEDSVGALNIINEPDGQALILLNQEVRFPIMGWVNGVGFIDAGNTYKNRGDLSFSDLMVGYGFGIRLDTPFAMLRVDFGIPGSRLPNSTRLANRIGNGRFYIGIGHIF